MPTSSDILVADSDDATSEDFTAFGGAPSSVRGAAEHLNDDFQDAVDLGLVGRCVEEAAGSTRAGALRFSLRSSSASGKRSMLQLQSATHRSDGHHLEQVQLEHCQQHALVTTTYLTRG